MFLIRVATKLLKLVVFRVFCFLYQKRAMADFNRKVGSCAPRRGKC